jgi:uncharacterized RDD family membrane protein YckC
MTTTPVRRPAALKTRIHAFLVDATLITATTVSVVAYAFVALEDRFPSATLKGILIFLFVLTTLAYFVLAEWLLGGTLAKLTLGLRVLSTSSDSLQFRSALLRNGARILDLLFFGLVPLLTGKRRRLGDLLAGTMVVQHSAVLRRAFTVLQVVCLMVLASSIYGLRRAGAFTRPTRAVTSDYVTPADVAPDACGYLDSLSSPLSVKGALRRDFYVQRSGCDLLLSQIWDVSAEFERSISFTPPIRLSGFSVSQINPMLVGSGGTYTSKVKINGVVAGEEKFLSGLSAVNILPMSGWV